MILILTIILFIIFLIYSIRPRKSEEYTLEGLKLSWKNKASIEGVVTKWIITLKDSSGSVIHTYENSDAGNLKDYTDVTVNIVDKKDFDTNIIGDNTLELYYNETKDGNKLYTKTVTFTEDDFGYIIDMSKLEEIEERDRESESTSTSGIRYVWFGYEKSSWSGRPLNIREIEVYSGGVNIVKGFGGDKVESETGFYRDGAQFPPQQLFDQNTSAVYNFGHTNSGETNYFKIDLGKEYSVIDKVMVYNRTDCCQDRWAGTFVKLLDDNGDEIVRSTETLPDNKTEAKNYKEGNVHVKTFTFPKAAALAPVPVKVVFHWGSFNPDYSYGYADTTAAASAGHVYDNTPPGKYSFGTLNGYATPSNTTATYKWTPPGTVTADVLIVAGGGGGGGVMGGGGGAGGLVFAPGESFSGEQTVVVGNGGEGGTGWNTSTQNGTSGSNSTCLTYTAKGGGGGIHYGGNTDDETAVAEKVGGSGGGGARGSYTGGSSNQDKYSGKGFGNNGGSRSNNSTPGGGGGAGGAGGNGVKTNRTAGIGGIGKDYSSTFTTTYGDNGWFASGGGGGTYKDYTNGTASEGGGTDGSDGEKADDAQPHTGGGGGGGGYAYKTQLQRGGNGGSGVVIFKGSTDTTTSSLSTTSTPSPSATPTNQDCEGHWVNDPTGRSSSKAQKNYKTVKYVVTKPKSGTGKDCMWAFTRKNPHVGATDGVTRNWAGYAFGNDQWTSEVVTDGQKGEVFNYQNTKGYRMNDPMHGEEFENLSEWKQNYLRFCMRKPNVALDYSKNISGRNKDVYTDAYGTTKSLYHQCDDDDD